MEGGRAQMMLTTQSSRTMVCIASSCYVLNVKHQQTHFQFLLFSLLLRSVPPETKRILLDNKRYDNNAIYYSVNSFHVWLRKFYQSRREPLATCNSPGCNLRQSRWKH